MATFTAKICGLPAGVTEGRLNELLSKKGTVVSLQLSRNSCTVKLESDSLFSRLKSAPTGTMGLISFLSMDSSGLGELRGSTISML